MNTPRHLNERPAFAAAPGPEPPIPQVKSAELSIRRDAAWRHERVALAAYYLALNRGFEPGHEAEDWSLAELQIDAMDAGRGVPERVG